MHATFAGHLSVICLQSVSTAVGILKVNGLLTAVKSGTTCHVIRNDS